MKAKNVDSFNSNLDWLVCQICQQQRSRFSAGRIDDKYVCEECFVHNIPFGLSTTDFEIEQNCKRQYLDPIAWILNVSRQSNGNEMKSDAIPKLKTFINENQR